MSEQFWFCGITIDNWTTASTPPPGRTISDLIADYRRTTDKADTIIAGWIDLNQVVETPVNGRPRCTARWILQHMITETARHAGHADILREEIDGMVGR